MNIMSKIANHNTGRENLCLQKVKLLAVEEIVIVQAKAIKAQEAESQIRQQANNFSKVKKRVQYMHSFLFILFKFFITIINYKILNN